MPMVLPAAYVTADMVRAMPNDGQRYELVWGELLVNPAPRPAHQRLVLRLGTALSTYCDTVGIVEAMLSPADITWSDDTLVQPDLFVVPRTEAASGDWRRVRTLLLVIEVLSPGTARHGTAHSRRARAAGADLSANVGAPGRERRDLTPPHGMVCRATSVACPRPSHAAAQRLATAPVARGTPRSAGATCARGRPGPAVRRRPARAP